MDTAAKVETLFSLELLVEYVNVGPETQAKPSPLLAVAFRLLDFPTLLVHQTEPQRAETLRRSWERGQERPGPVRTGARTGITFNKGKSCLFKMGMSTLHRYLTNTPLYAMLLDVSQRVPKLLGSCLISMASAVEKIRLDVEECGITTPSMQGKRGLYPLYNLMGVKIGQISAGYRLMSLGVGLLPHVPENQVLKAEMRNTNFEHLPSEGQVPEQGEKEKVADQGTGHIPTDSQKHFSHMSGDQAVEGRQFDQIKEPIIISALKGEHKLSALAKEASKIKQQVLKFEPTVDIKMDNVFCPPPMYYSQSKEGPKEEISEMWKTMEPEEETAILEELDSDESDELFDMSQSDFKLPKSHSEVTSTLKTQVQKKLANSDALDTIRQLPLLNALLLELSLLNHEQLPQQIPLVVHPQLAWLYSSLKNDSLEFYEPTKSTIQQSNSHFKQQKVQKQPVSPRNFDKENNPRRCNAKKNLEHPKRKLMYGLTNTLRLRLQQTNPGMLIVHEQKELSRKRQLKQLKEKIGQKCREGKGEGRSSPLQKGQQFSGDKAKENTETLIQSSSEPDTAHPSKVQRNGKFMDNNSFEATLRHGSATRTGEPLVQPPGPLNYNAKISDLQMANDRDLYQKYIKVRLPEIISHDSDHSVNEICSEAVDVANMKPGLTSDQIIVENVDAQISYSSCDESKYSEDFTSPEPTGNSEDFTSPEPTNRFADTLGSSTEAATIRVKHRYSDNELDLSLSKYSSDNQGAAQSETEDDSVPLPALSKQSPIQSLKGTSLVHSHHQRMTLSSTTSNLSEEATSLTEENQPKKILNPSNKQETEKQLKSTVQSDSGFDINRASPEVPQLSSSRNRHRLLEESQSLGTSQVSSYAPSSEFDLVCSGLGVTAKDIQTDESNELGRTGIINECRHISELVANKLPGYTL
ncbi:microtubule-associated protein 10 [Hypanus sabinus]|uniref:microtubule-associated protein 10 n=1 Tax=Hypanus sabinus TaxID=79690 RepID=UPI0028C3D578|nr:microtubule-associated protein 10 [Hypanus sabinus]